MSRSFKSKEEFKKTINSIVYSSCDERDWYQTWVCDDCSDVGKPLKPGGDIEDYSYCWCCNKPFGDHLSKKLHYGLVVRSNDGYGYSVWCRVCKNQSRFKENVHVNHYRCYCCGGRWDSLRKRCLGGRKAGVGQRL